MKIVGIGLNKTGTTTLGVCLRYWGLNHISFSAKGFDVWRERDIDRLMRWVGMFDSFEDWPWPLIYPQIDQAFPGSKFILTRRADPQVWYASLCKHALRTGPTRFRAEIYGHAMPQDHQAEHIALYEDHLLAVRRYFKDRPQDLLEVCWEEGDGWQKLSSFLGFDCPTVPFPHANKSPT